MILVPIPAWKNQDLDVLLEISFKREDLTTKLGFAKSQEVGEEW